MSTSGKKIEVERKYKVRSNLFAGIAAGLIERGFEKVPTQQRDTYLCVDDIDLTRRVRLEKRPTEVVYFLTDKRKVTDGPNTNDEDEEAIEKSEYDRRIVEQKVVLFGVTLVVRKNRVHFHGLFRQRQVTICLDVAFGPRRIRLGSFVELEVMVARRSQVRAAHALLKALAAEVLPKSRRRESRGYRNMLLQALTRAARRSGKFGKNVKVPSKKDFLCSAKVKKAA